MGPKQSLDHKCMKSSYWQNFSNLRFLNVKTLAATSGNDYGDDDDGNDDDDDGNDDDDDDADAVDGWFLNTGASIDHSLAKVSEHQG